MPQVPELLLSALFSQAMGSSERTEALPAHPWPCPQARHTVTTRKCPSMGCDGAAGACRALGESQESLFRQAQSCLPITAGVPPRAPRANSHIQVSACFIPTPKGCVCARVCRGRWLPLPPSRTHKMQVAVGPPSSLNLPSTARDTHAQGALRVASACTYVRAEGPEAPHQSPCTDIWSTGKCQSCHRVCWLQGDRVALQGVLSPLSVLKSEHQRLSPTLRQRCPAGKK